MHLASDRRGINLRRLIAAGNQPSRSAHSLARLVVVKSRWRRWWFTYLGRSRGGTVDVEAPHHRPLVYTYD